MLILQSVVGREEAKDTRCMTNKPACCSITVWWKRKTNIALLYFINTFAFWEKNEM